MSQSTANPSFIVRILVPGLLLCGPLFMNGCDRSGAAPTATVIDAGAIEAALDAAEAYRNTNDIAKAEAILGRLIERAPRDWRAHELMGRVLSQKAVAEDAKGTSASARATRREALECYETAVALNPGSGGLRQSAGVVAMMAGETDAALVHFEHAGAIDPANPQPPLFAAQILIGRTDFTGAEAALGRVLEIDPDEPAAYASLGMIALEGGRTDDARRFIAEARTIAPGDIRFRVQEARIYRRTGDARRAVELLSGLSPQTRAEDGVCDELAAAFTALDRHDSAAQAWSHAYRSRPPDSNTARLAAQAGLAFLRAGSNEEAAEWLSRARSQAEIDPRGGIDPLVRELEELLIHSSDERDG